MTSFAFSVMFLLVTSQPATEQTAQPTAAPETPVATATAPEPKMICKYERTTGSRVQKTKVCRPENEKGSDQDTALQRALSRNGDYRDLTQSGLGN